MTYYNWMEDDEIFAVAGPMCDEDNMIDLDEEAIDGIVSMVEQAEQEAGTDDLDGEATLWALPIDSHLHWVIGIWNDTNNFTEEAVFICEDDEYAYFKSVGVEALGEVLLRKPIADMTLDLFESFIQDQNVNRI